MRAITVWLIATVAITNVIWTQQATPLPKSGFSPETSWIRSLDIDKLDPANKTIRTIPTQQRARHTPP
ncbi:MAG: hypothetical protein KatS3mg019_1070 [Fimbriimonadales bacterium]|nr:MAG: hypothetical protein KatS3mg019_1070 [Fimbriimonadales bacterium]